MIWEWIAEKGRSLIAFLMAMGLLGISFLEPKYRYFFIVIAIAAAWYGYRQLKKHDTPFQRHEREIKRKQL